MRNTLSMTDDGDFMGKIFMFLAIVGALLIMCQWYVFLSIRKFILQRGVPVTRKVAYTVLGILGVVNYVFIKVGFDPSLLLPDSLGRQVVLVSYFTYLGWVLVTSLFFLLLGTLESTLRFKDLVFSFAAARSGSSHSLGLSMQGDAPSCNLWTEKVDDTSTEACCQGCKAESPGAPLREPTSSYRDEKLSSDVADTITSRRSFLKWSASVGLATTAGFAGWGVASAYREPEIEEFEFQHPALAGFNRSLTFIQITDFHFGLFIRAAELERIVETLNSIDGDALFITGDMLHSPVTPASHARPILRRLRPRRYGNFAVMGNHDFYAGEYRAVKLFDRSGLRLLRDEWITYREDGLNLHLGGIDDPMENWLWGKEFPGFTTFMKGMPAEPGMRVLLSHRPNILPLASQEGIDFILSGHIHGGQVIVPMPKGHRGISLARIASRFTHGWYTMEDCHMYLSRGVGLTFVPWRVNCPPEIAVFHLKAPDGTKNAVRPTGLTRMRNLLRGMRNNGSLRAHRWT